MIWWPGSVPERWVKSIAAPVSTVLKILTIFRLLETITRDNRWLIVHFSAINILLWVLLIWIFTMLLICHKKMFNENLGKNVALRFKILLSFDMILYTSKILNFLWKFLRVDTMILFKIQNLIFERFLFRQFGYYFILVCLPLLLD